MHRSLFPQSADDVPIDSAVVNRLHGQAVSAGGVYEPSDAWRLNERSDVTYGSEKIIKPEDMLRMWIGGAAIGSPSADLFNQYRSFFKEIGAPSFIRTLCESLIRLRQYELGTLHDLCMIQIALGGNAPEMPTYLEIGGGFGRLADGILHMFEGKAKVIMVDAVPESLVGTFSYLSARWGDLKSIRLCDEPLTKADLKNFDILIVPTWHAKSDLLADSVDIISSVAAMQEMTDEQVSWSIDLCDSALRYNGVVYFAHSRDYVYPRGYRYPEGWRLILKRNTPRSYSIHYPVELFRKVGGDSSKHNAILDAQYLAEVALLYAKAGRSEALAHRAAMTKATERIRQLKHRIDRTQRNSSPSQPVNPTDRVENNQ